MKFNEMNLIAPLAKAIEECGYATPTPIQEATIIPALAGKDILGCAQTGTGKTCAFALPVLQRLQKNSEENKSVSDNSADCSICRVRSLVLAPTRELTIQNYETFVKLSTHLKMKSTVIYGGVGQDKQVRELNGGTDVLAATPGRLLDLIRQKIISLASLEILVIDEADRMLDMGFIRDVKAIIALTPSVKQTMLFSATMPDEVESLAEGLLNDPVNVKVDPVTSTVDKISQSVYFVERENKKNLLLNLLLEKGVSTALVFTRTKGNADQLVRVLNKNKIDAMAIHGNKSQNARQKALESFKSGKISVLAATDIAARGIDISELPFVINYNIPEEAETYIHRIGRTGRAGLGGTAINICCADEIDLWRAVKKLTGANVEICECQWSSENIKEACEATEVKRQAQRRAAKALNVSRASGDNAQNESKRPEKSENGTSERGAVTIRTRQGQFAKRAPARNQSRNQGQGDKRFASHGENKDRREKSGKTKADGNGNGRGYFGSKASSNSNGKNGKKPV